MAAAAARHTMSSVFFTLRQPCTWALALLITESEAASFASIRGQDTLLFANADLLSSAICIAAYAMLFLFARKARALTANSWTAVIASAFSILGMMLTTASGASLGAPYLLFILSGDACVSISGVILFFCVLECLATRNVSDVKLMLMAASAINAVLIPFAVAYPTAVFFASTALCAPVLFFSVKTSFPSEQKQVSVHSPSKRSIAFPFDLAGGLFIISLCFGFSQSFLYQMNGTAVAAIVSFTKLAAVIVFAAAMHWANDMGYAALAKLTSTLSIASFALFLAFGFPSAGASAVMATGYSLLEITLYLLIVDMSALSNAGLIRIASVFYLIDSAGYLAGEIMSECSFAGLLDQKAIAVTLIMLLMIMAVWIFQDKKINTFLWGSGKMESEAEEATPLPFEKRIEIMADQYGLSPRETDVLKLFAAGRSAVFIAELMFISTNTVRTHIKHIYEKCGIHSRQELISLIESLEESWQGPKNL